MTSSRPRIPAPSVSLFLRFKRGSDHIIVTPGVVLTRYKKMTVRIIDSIIKRKEI